MAVKAMVVCSPVARSMSISRSLGNGHQFLGHFDELIGHAAHGGDDHDHLVALGAITRHPRGDIFDALRIGDRRACTSIFLQQSRHRYGLHLPFCRGHASRGRIPPPKFSKNKRLSAERHESNTIQRECKYIFAQAGEVLKGHSKA
jgi:hypothetical protein